MDASREAAMMLLREVVPVVLVGVCVLAGCSPDGPGTADPTPPGATTSSASSSGTPSADAALDDKVAEARRLVERDHGVDPAELEVVRAERVTWPDSSYGCPRGEQTYEPGPFPGYRIVLALGKRDFTYQGGEDTELQECLLLE
jgi:hypothetical protein